MYVCVCFSVWAGQVQFPRPRQPQVHWHRRADRDAQNLSTRHTHTTHVHTAQTAERRARSTDCACARGATSCSGPKSGQSGGGAPPRRHSPSPAPPSVFVGTLAPAVLRWRVCAHAGVLCSFGLDYGAATACPASERAYRRRARRPSVCVVATGSACRAPRTLRAHSPAVVRMDGPRRFAPRPRDHMEAGGVAPSAAADSCGERCVASV